MEFPAKNILGLLYLIVNSILQAISLTVSQEINFETQKQQFILQDGL